MTANIGSAVAAWDNDPARKTVGILIAKTETGYLVEFAWYSPRMNRTMNTKKTFKNVQAVIG